MIYFSFCCDSKYRVKWYYTESGRLDSMCIADNRVQSPKGSDTYVAFETFEELNLSSAGSRAFQKLVEGLLEIDRPDAVRELPVREMRMLERLENFDPPEILIRGFNWRSEYLRWSDVHDALCGAKRSLAQRVANTEALRTARVFNSTSSSAPLDVETQAAKDNWVMIRRDDEGMCEELTAIPPTTKPQPTHWTSRIAPMDAKLNPFVPRSSWCTK